LRRRAGRRIWYVDDILILVDSQESISTNLEVLIQTCNDAGLIVNESKSQLPPSQQVNYLGHKINLKARMVVLQQKKLKRGLEMTKAYLRRRKLSPANIAGRVGTLLDLQKGHVALHGLAKCITKEASWKFHGELAVRLTPHSPKNWVG